MLARRLDYYLRHLGHDVPAGVVVFLVAIPLCLGIAVASGAPPFSGILAGIVGGLVVSILSGSQISVSGPAAGLTVIVATAIDNLGYDGLLLAVVIAGLLQIVMGFLGAGIIGAYFPSAVIKGMLAAIGLILILKQLPHLVGYDVEMVKDVSFIQAEGGVPIEVIVLSLQSILPGAALIGVVSMAILILWDMPWIKRHAWLHLVPGPLVAVIFGTAFNAVATVAAPALAVTPQQLVDLPAIFGPIDFVRQLSLPDFSRALEPQVYVVAATLAIVASLETLLSLEATDKLDPLKRTAPTNRELKAQGVGNFLSGLVGGLPITAVIVRSSANVNAGARTKAASSVHGLLLLSSAMFLAGILNLIPLACLAAVLLVTGYKLAKPALFKEQYTKGLNQFAPFIATIVAILLTDLLLGMAIGMAIGLVFVLWANYRNPFTLTRDGSRYLLRMQKDVSFLNKAPLRAILEHIEGNSYVVVDGSRASFVDPDIVEMLEDFAKAAPDDNISVELKNIHGLSSAVTRQVVQVPKNAAIRA